jgi:hypothetical protein
VNVKVERGSSAPAQSTQPPAETKQPAPAVRAAPNHNDCAACHKNGVPQKKPAAEKSAPSKDTRLGNQDTRTAGSGADTRLASPDTRLTSQFDRGPLIGLDPRVHANPAPAPGSDTAASSAPSTVAKPAPEKVGPPTLEEQTAHVQANPDDFHAMRDLAIAQLAAKKPRDAAETLAKAYKADPLLSKEPLDPKALGLSTAALNSLVNNASAMAHSLKTPEAWLLSAVLYQAQDAKPQALIAIDSARRAGLDPDLCDWMVTSLKKSAQTK